MMAARGRSNMSFLSSCLSLLLACATCVLATQEAQHALLTEDHHSSSAWKLNFSSAAPHYFHSVHSLLQQWPNTYFPNGHSLTTGTIPAFTKLYHGRRDADPPPSPEWLAFDIDMSYGIMGSGRDSFMLTYQTTRPVKALYFDGESATLMGVGQMDTQMLHLYGNTTGPEFPDRFRGLRDEYARAIGLCDWMGRKQLGGLGWGFEAVVRMNAGFEVIWCNFTSPSIRLVSQLNVTAPLLGIISEDAFLTGQKQPEPTKSYFPMPPNPTRTDRDADPSNPVPPPNWRHESELDREPFLRSQGWEWFKSATRHYGSSAAGPGLGEHRMKIDTCGFMSYYGPEYESAARARSVSEQKSLNITKDGSWLGPNEIDSFRNATTSRKIALDELTRRRRAHALGAVNTNDAAVMRQNSERVLLYMASTKNSGCSGVDWHSITTEIIARYADDLLRFTKLLASPPELTNRTALRRYFARARDQTHIFLLPFMEYPADVAEDGIWDRDGRLYREAFARCKFHHTRLLDPDLAIQPTLLPEEEHIKNAVEEVMHNICATTITISFSLESLWARSFNSPSTSPPPPGLASILKDWKSGTEELMAWLGWASEWTQCEQICAWDEVCYIPMWPLINMGRGGLEHPPPQRGHNDTRNPPISTSGEPPRQGPPRRGRSGYGRPGYGYGPPGGGRPPGWMADETDLWTPRCVGIGFIMGDEGRILE